MTAVIAADWLITTTPTDFVGRGTSTVVNNGENFVFRFTNMVWSDAGQQIRVRAVVVRDLSTDDLRVEKTDFTCVRA